MKELIKGRIVYQRIPIMENGKMILDYNTSREISKIIQDNLPKGYSLITTSTYLETDENDDNIILIIDGIEYTKGYIRKLINLNISI